MNPSPEETLFALALEKPATANLRFRDRYNASQSYEHSRSHRTIRP
jgi:hypothetical protein